MSQRPDFLSSIQGLPGGRERLARILEEAPFGVSVDDPTESCTYANQALLDQFGIGWEEFQGFGWARFVLEKDAERLREAIRVFESTLEPIHVSDRMRGKDQQLRWIHARVETLLDAEGRHLGSLGITEDRTEQQKYEERSARTQKMEAIGRLPARLAHDFNNLLTPILFSIDLFEQHREGPVDPGLPDTMRHAVEQASQLTGQLLTLSRHRVSRHDSCVLDEEIDKLSSLLRRTLGEGIDLRIRLEAGEAAIRLDAGRLDQVLLNLATNGADAMQGYGRLEILSRLTEGRVQVEVRDQGSGMEPEVQAHAFDPFFTTKVAGQGTGLGLATVHDLLTLAGGSIAIETEPGRGTTMRFELPALDRSSDQARGPAPRTVEFGEEQSGRRVLLIEDQDALRQSLAYSLALQGFAVTGARSLGEARSRIDEEGLPEILISDVMLPDGRSPDLIDELRAHSARLPVLLISGYAGEGQLQLQDDCIAFLEKPFGSSAFLLCLSDLLSCCRSQA